MRLNSCDTCLSGKCHFIGPDQLHGFERRLTTDVCPSGFLWNGDWDRPDVILRMVPYTEECGDGRVAERSIQQDHDEGRHRGDPLALSMGPQGRAAAILPFSSPFSASTDPYVTPQQRYWNGYDHEAIDLPTLPNIPLAERDP